VNQYTVTVDGRDYDVDAPDENTAWTWANQFAKQRTQRMTQATQADVAANTAAQAQSEADRPWLQRAAINLGAGLDTAWQGTKQLFGGGPDDAELTEQRRLKAEAAKNMTGGGFIQGVGETLPTAVVPGGAGLKAAMKVGAAAGGLGGAMQPVTSDESRLWNTAGGTALGTAGGAAVHGAIRGLPLATKRGRDAYMDRNIGRELTGNIERAGETVGDVINRLKARRGTGTVNVPGVTDDIPLTAAEQSGSMGLARRELMARRDEPDLYGEFGRRQNEAIFDAATNRAGVEGTEQFQRLAENARDLQTAGQRTAALESAGRWSSVGEPLGEVTAALRSSSAAGSPQRNLANLVDATLAENPSPQQLYELRKMLAAKLSGPPKLNDDVSAIVKGAERETMRLIKAIDSRLDEAASSKTLGDTPFSDYMTEYSRRSRPVSSAKAQRQITEELSSDTKPLLGNAPEVTRAGLAKTVAKYGTNKQGHARLTPEAYSRYYELNDLLRHKEEPMRAAKLGGTGGGGSQTAFTSRLGNAALSTAFPKLAMAKNVATLGLDAKQSAIVAKLLQDPQATAAILEKAASNIQLSPIEAAVAHLLRQGGGGTVNQLLGE
jgi:hypothetical protein